jgi:sodium/proline symporter
VEIQILCAFIVYFCVLAAIGIVFYTKAKNESGYVLGGRSVNYWVTAIATQSSDMGSWLFLAFPAAVYLHGVPECWTAIGLVMFMYLNWQLVAPRLRVATEKNNNLTFTSYLNNRFNDKSNYIGMISAVITIIFFTYYVGSGLVGLGRLFQAAFGIEYHTGLIVGLSSALIFTLIGGFLAVAWTNLFQGIFLLIMIVLVPIYALYNIGSINSIAQAAANKNISLSLFFHDGSIWQSLFLAAGWGLGYFGQPHILVNFMGIDDPKKINAAKYVGIVWQIIVLTAAAAIGLIAIPYFANQTLENPELLFIVMAKQLFVPFLAGFVLCAILAAALSTIATQILISGTIFAEDIYKKKFHGDANSKHIVWISRLAVIGASLAALAISWNNSNSIYDAVSYAWSGLGSSFSAIVLLSLYSNKVTRQGALAGIMVGAVVSGLWPYVNSSVMPLIPGFTMSLLTIIIVSAFTSKSEHLSQTNIKP